MKQSCKNCGIEYRFSIRQYPVHCSCGAVAKNADDLAGEQQVDERRQKSERKIAICRSNVCGHYDAENDACGILRSRGKAGKVTYLLMRPQTRCVADEPLF